MALWVAHDFGKITSHSDWRAKKVDFGGIVGSHGRHQRKWCESFQSEAQQRSTGLKKEHFICGLWSSLQRLSLAYLALPCPLLSLVSLCYLTIVTLWYSLLSCWQLLYYHPPRYRSVLLCHHKSTCACVSQKSCGKSHRGPQRQVYHNARGCLLRLLQSVLGALQSAHPSQQASTMHLGATYTRQEAGAVNTGC